MSFQSRDFWMAKGATNCLTGGEMAYNDSSRIEQKRSQQWFLGAMEPDVFPNKKQAVETSYGRPISGVPNVGLSWENPSCFQPAMGQFTDRFFGSEPARTINFGGGNFQSFNIGNLNVGRRGIEEQFGNDSSVSLSMSHATEDLGSFLGYGGIRKVKINQVKDSDNGMYAPMGHTFSKDDNNTISFGGFQEGPVADRLISNYDSLMNQSSIQQLEASKEKEFSNSNVDVHVSATPSVVTKAKTPKTKVEPKMSNKAPLNNFPSNVRSLLSTGILDGVPVKYISWSHEELRGVIKGSGYSCGCQSCNYSQVLNAYEFERHAGFKTKHPNNHIFFDNGKTIYGIVQELKSTPQNMLFEAIQTVTGSPINQKSFRIWKESFQAAIRELQRIYGKDDINQLFQNEDSNVPSSN